MLTTIHKIVKGDLTQKIVRIVGGQYLFVQSDSGNKVVGLTVCQQPTCLTVDIHQIAYTNLELTDKEFEQLINLYKLNIAVEKTKACWEKLQKRTSPDAIKEYHEATKHQRELKDKVKEIHIEEDRFNLNVK